MSEYIKTGWQNQIKDPEGNVVQLGTPVDEVNLNKMEQGIYDAHMEIENIHLQVGEGTPVPATRSIITPEGGGLEGGGSLGEDVTLNIKQGGVTDVHIGDRTVDQAITTPAAAHTGRLNFFLSWFAKMLRLIIGLANWYSTPEMSIHDIFLKIGNMTPVPNTRNIGTEGGIQGGGDLSADRIFSIKQDGVTDAHIGNRTVDQAITTPAAHTGRITFLLSWVAKTIKAITGRANWYDTPVASIQDINTNLNNHTLNTTDAHDINKYMPLLGGKFGGSVDHDRQQLIKPAIKDYSEVLQSNAAATGAVNLDMAGGNVFEITLTGNTTLTFSNAAPTGAYSFTLFVTLGSTPYAITWPASVKWNKDQIPALVASKEAVFTFVTRNGGARWIGMVGGCEFAL